MIEAKKSRESTSAATGRVGSGWIAGWLKAWDKDHSTAEALAASGENDGQLTQASLEEALLDLHQRLVEVRALQAKYQHSMNEDAKFFEQITASLRR